MTFREFEDKLKAVKEEYKVAKGQYPETIRELELYLMDRLSGRQKSRSLRSLKGFSF